MINSILNIEQRFICWPGKILFQNNNIFFDLQNQEEIFKFSQRLFFEVQRTCGLGYEDKFLVYQFIIEYLKKKTSFFPETIKFQYYYHLPQNFSWHKIYDKFFRELFVVYWEKETDEKMKSKIRDLFLDT